LNWLFIIPPRPSLVLLAETTRRDFYLARPRGGKKENFVKRANTRRGVLRVNHRYARSKAHRPSCRRPRVGAQRARAKEKTFLACRKGVCGTEGGSPRRQMLPAGIKLGYNYPGSGKSGRKRGKRIVTEAKNQCVVRVVTHLRVRKLRIAIASHTPCENETVRWRTRRPLTGTSREGLSYLS